MGTNRKACFGRSMSLQPVLRTMPRKGKRQPLMQRLSWFLSLQNVTANHRANDVIAAEDGPQVLVGRFMYGPLDMVALTGEKVQRLGIPSLTAHTRTRCLMVPHGMWAEG